MKTNWFISFLKNNFKHYFKTRRIGFYMVVATSILCLIAALSYRFGYKGNEAIGEYYVSNISLILLLGFVISGPLLTFDVTSEFAAPVLWITTLIALCRDIKFSYMYLTTVFFGGLSVDALMTMELGYILPKVLMLFILVLSFVAMLLGQGRRKRKNEQN